MQLLIHLIKPIIVAINQQIAIANRSNTAIPELTAPEIMDRPLINFPIPSTPQESSHCISGCSSCLT